MAAAGGGTAAVVNAAGQGTLSNGTAPAVRLNDRPPAEFPNPTVAQRLFAEGFAFDFFQAVRVLEKADPARVPIGLDGPPAKEIVRFRAHLSLAFPPSMIYEIEPASSVRPVPAMTVAFLGLTGPSGVLPTHYTELLLLMEKGRRDPEQRALREWLDLFNHRLIALFYRSWQKYRFYLAYERGFHATAEPDPFTRCLLSLVGIGMPSLRRRLRVAVRMPDHDQERDAEQALARIDDRALVYYGGLLAHRPRCAVSLEELVQDYFQLPARVLQFQGEWLRLDTGSQSVMGEGGQNNQLGVNLVAGERVWDVQGKFRLRLGPLAYADFVEFLPDRSPLSCRKLFFLLNQLVRFYVGAELAFDVQLILRAADVPPCCLSGEGFGPRLGWNTWACSHSPEADAEDVVLYASDPEFFVHHP